ncbi:sigma 54-interacting transcriptional regulator [Bacillus sp. CGMCC 1.16541]|uniref:sigma-54 interaction domain-containing protein n=1 Tax=Bacillus sp. CGMCC 1.16541 TaxID=2185143 RepID=UPI000D7392D9|nr:sigma 54-interacting transcriptional regulator [Bacillus sp. CGMCC 1.16541]
MSEQDLNYLQYVKRTYEKVMDELDVGLHVVDRTGKTILYNKKMMQLESMNSEDVMNKHFLDVFMFRENEESTLVKALQSGKATTNVTQTYFNNKGKKITTINNTFPIIEGSDIQGAVEIAKDVTKIERLVRENIKRKGSARYTFDSIIGKSAAVQELLKNAKRATRTSSYVLIIGETGTGKELFAQGIHNGSNRSSAPFISQNCAALPENLIESLLFGTKKGAFTGAMDHPGLFEQAEGGTLLLDEINSLNPNLQAKLFRVLQEKTIKRIGDTNETPIDVRVIANINEDPIEAIANNHLRKDLYYRLGVVTLFVPPLRERKEDIPFLSEHFINKYNQLFQMDIKGLDSEVMDLFLTYDWPGNIRELEHIIEAAMNVMIEDNIIQYAHLPLQYRNKWKKTDRVTVAPKITAFVQEKKEEQPLKDQLDAYEKQCIEHALKQSNGKVSHAAKLLGLSRQTLQYRMKKLDINVQEVLNC